MPVHRRLRSFGRQPKGALPRLSDHWSRARRQAAAILQFELLMSVPGRPARFDSKATLDLMAAGAKEAIAAMKQCAGAPAPDA
jgi:hypothetical protein